MNAVEDEFEDNEFDDSNQPENNPINDPEDPNYENTQYEETKPIDSQNDNDNQENETKEDNSDNIEESKDNKSDLVIEQQPQEQEQQDQPQQQEEQYEEHKEEEYQQPEQQQHQEEKEEEKYNENEEEKENERNDELIENNEQQPQEEEEPEEQEQEEEEEEEEQKDNESQDENTVQDFIQVLEEHRKNCEKQGKYVEAEIAKNRLEELRLHEENRRREQMRSRQIAETLGVEEAHMMEYQEFNVEWDKKMADYEQHSKELLDEMKNRHEEELARFQEELISKQAKPKFSSELLNLRRVQDVLARQKDYAEAHKIKLKADSLEAWEVEKWKNKKQTEMYRKEGKFKNKQDQELKALHMRIQAGREEQKKRRQLDLERLLLRYQNVKAALEIQHTQEKMRFDRTARLNATS